MKHGYVLTLTLVVALYTLFLPLTGAQTPFSPSQSPTPVISMLLPLYKDPSEPGDDWAKVALAAKRIPITVIINPNNGPDVGGPSDEYRVGIAALRSGNAIVVGYIPTNYGNRPIADVRKDVDIYAALYTLDGIFIDETAQEAEKTSYYADIAAYVHTKFAADQLVFNPGLAPDVSYFSTIDRAIFTVFESDQRAWTQLALPPYIAQQASNRLAALIYDVPTGAQCSTIIDQAVQRHIGLVYVTSRTLADNPWNGIPTYWDTLVDSIERVNQNNSST